MLRTQGNNRTPVLTRSVNDPEPVTPVAAGGAPIYGATGEVSQETEGTGSSPFFPNVTNAITFALQSRSTIQIAVTYKFEWSEITGGDDLSISPFYTRYVGGGIVFPYPNIPDFASHHSSTAVNNPSPASSILTRAVDYDSFDNQFLSNYTQTITFLGVATRDAGTYTLGLWNYASTDANVQWSASIVVGANTENDDLTYPGTGG